MNDLDAVVKARENDANHIMRLVKIDNRAVLEIGCGSGRVTFELAEKAGSIVAIDIDTQAIEKARKRNRFDNVTFLVENVETVQLGVTYDVILSTWMGYMYLNAISKAVSNIASHLKDDGVFLLCCGSPEDEYGQIVDLLVEENIKSVAFYRGLEFLLSDHFTFENHILRGELAFSSLEEVIAQYQSELKTEHGIEMKSHHQQRLKDYMDNKGSYSIGWDSQAYLCKKK
jgi:SAM-dependent methyltransferase